MPTDEGPAPTGGRARLLTRLPDRGSVIVRSPGPPEVPAGRCVDVRPGPGATFDGDRLRLSLSVTADGERRRFDRRDLPAVGDAVTAFLGREAGDADGRARADPTATGRGGADARTPGGHVAPTGRRTADGPAVVRFGDRTACLRVLPAASVAAIERRLASAAAPVPAVLVTWATDGPRAEDYLTYDVVLDRPTGRTG